MGITDEMHYPSLARLSVAVLLLPYLIGCGIAMGRLANRNRDDFPRLRPGMTRAEVVEVMGTQSGMAPQPWRCVASHDSTGAAINIWYYLMQRPYDQSEREYLSPIVFQDDVVLGIGWDFLDDVGRHFMVIGNRNRSRISRLTEGMTKEQIVYLMTHEPPNLGAREDRTYVIPQPHRTVTHPLPGDGQIEIWYYLVSKPAGGGEAWDYLAPVVLKDEILIGTGWEKTREIAEHYDFVDALLRFVVSSGCK
ncbi:MAG TPA: hypothetical protein VMR66_09755 [Gemmatimonadota bacterium]|nr:hypothetical protein [Gemmatimonadota bacterium]